MKKTYVKPEVQVFEIERQVLLGGSNNSFNASTDGDEPGPGYGGGTSENGIPAAD